MTGGVANNLPHPIPDWKQYKIDGIKELEWTQRTLASKGLKDPWLRNEVWRYKNFTSPGRMALVSFSRGFKWAFAAIVLTVAVDQFLGFGYSSRQKARGSHH